MEELPDQADLWASLWSIFLFCDVGSATPEQEVLEGTRGASHEEQVSKQCSPTVSASVPA